MNIPDAPIVELEIGGMKRKFDLDNPVLPKWVEDNVFASDGYPYKKKLKSKHYDKELYKLQEELVKVQYWLEQKQHRVISIFEGRDAAGKGGSINAIRQNLNARAVRTVALTKPSDIERGQWYFQRYIDHFPTHGEMVLFDRSWYNRAGVEPVMGFCTHEQHEKFLNEAPAFEELITKDGVFLFKFWLTIGQETQLKRFHDRRHDPVKVWKLSPIDIKALSKWDDYANARDLMFERTHTAHAPWTIVKANDKKRARLNLIRHMLHTLPYEGKNQDNIGKVDRKIVGRPK